MATVRKTITLTEQQDIWIKSQIAAGRFTNDSEVIRDAVRQAQSFGLDVMKRREPCEVIDDPWLAAELQKGINSQTSDRTPKEILDAAQAKYETNAKL